ncbi:MFS transporter [Sulfobacillus harzensis]|uniref:MFS transporter n=1 Tax=Sulfobacillus harzensis TaxID=2729629 RepID=A0A7Y0Q2W7_9FIRM|nr:MFS transporter [Sulfobacillus harzensis]NMP22321.1 MFS transporter [Sulfobacillus harzensis]
MQQRRIPLSPATRWLVLTFAGSTTAGAIASTFVNLFVFVVSGRLADLALFNGAYFFSLSFVFYLTGYLFRRSSPLVPYRWGLVMTAAFYGVLLLLLHHASHYILWLGLLEGVSQGFFWFGANLMTFDTVAPEQRIRFYGINSAVGSVAGIAGPLAGGAVVGLMHGLTGYLLVFALALAVYAMTFAISFSVPAGPPLGREPLTLSFSLHRIMPLWKEAMETLAVRGTREAMSGLAGVFLVYIATKSAWVVGVYSSVSAVMRMLGALSVSHVVTPERRPWSMWWGVIGMTAGALFLFLMHVSWIFVFVYAVIASFSMPWFTVPNEAIPLDVMDRDPEVKNRRVAFMLSREMSLNAGRLFSMAVLMLLYAFDNSPTMLIVMVAASSLAQGFVARMGSHIWRRLREARV